MRQVHAAYVIAKKDAVVYYLKPPVISFGLIFPLFFYLAFATGRDLPTEAMVPGIVAMALFFTASAVGPLITPWERQARTWERLATSPASLWAIIAGDVMAGMAFGIMFCLLPLGFGTLLLGAVVVDSAHLGLGIGLGALAFATLGVFVAAPVTSTPSQVMMISNLIRLPLIFVSGVFLPLASLAPWGRWLAPFSPLSYGADLIRVGFGGASYFGPSVDVTALLVFSGSFLILTRATHWVTRARIR